MPPTVLLLKCEPLKKKSDLILKPYAAQNTQRRSGMLHEFLLESKELPDYFFQTVRKPSFFFFLNHDEK